MVWYSHLFQSFPQFVLIHMVKGFSIVNNAEIDVFLELSCFSNDPVDVGNLVSGSSAFSKTSLNIGKFTVHILLKPGLENFSGLHSRRTRGDRHSSRVEAKNPALLSSRDGYLLELTGWTQGSQAS